MEALAISLGLMTSPLEAAIATSLRVLNDGSASGVARRFLSSLLAETGAAGAGLTILLDRQPTEILHAPGFDAVRKSGLSNALQGGRLSALGGFCKRWPLRDGGTLLVHWEHAPDGELIERLQSGQHQLDLFVRQMQQLATVESARLAWQTAIRHQAILSETLAWLNALETEPATHDPDQQQLYLGLLSRARIICNAHLGALALYRVDGARFQWLEQGLSELEVDLALKSRPHPPEPATLWQAPLQGRMVAMFELAITTPKGLRARLYLADKHERNTLMNFTQQDVAYINQLATQVFRSLEKVELMEDLQISNQFLSMERQDLNRLVTELKDTQQQLLHSEKLASIGQLAAGVAHEINNPMSFVSSNLFHLQQHFQRIETMLDHYILIARRNNERPVLAEQEWQACKGEIAELISESRDGLDRVRQIVQDLRNFSRAGEAGWQFVDLNECVESTLNIVRNEIRYKADLVKDYGELPPVQCVPGQINQVIMNLLVNAAQAIADRGQITLRTGRRGQEVFLQVADTGTGIEQQHVGRIFDPFFTTKPVGKGTGLGLSLSYGIIQRHHGRIEVDSKPDQGARFTVWLPVFQPEGETAPVTPGTGGT